MVILAAVITEAHPFSILLDESNDKVDKSCIILIKLLDPELGNVCTRFLDMPVVNIGNDMWVSVAELEQEHDTKPFFSAVRNFYIATIFLRRTHIML